MKIGILTYFGDINPGTTLQAYSIYKTISELFQECQGLVEIINYHSFRRINRSCLSAITPRGLLNDLSRVKKYRMFHKNMFKCSSPHLLTNDVEQATRYIQEQNYDRIYVGSDTCLELKYAKPDDTTIFWLPKEISSRKIMLSASARNVDYEGLSDRQRGLMKDAVSGFSHISVRDEATLRLIKALDKEKEVVRLCDPTFALEIDHAGTENYFEKKGLSKGERIIGINLVRGVPWVKELCELVRSKGYRVASLKPCRYADIEVNDLAPMEHASISRFFSACLTVSFHDTIFSLKNRVPVVLGSPCSAYFNHHGESKHRSLMQDFDLEKNGFIESLDDISAQDVWGRLEQSIELFDAAAVSERIERLKNQYLSFVRDASQ